MKHYSISNIHIALILYKNNIQPKDVSKAYQTIKALILYKNNIQHTDHKHIILYH